MAIYRGIGMKKISIITPCFNEEEGILECIKEIRMLFQTRLPHYDYEHIFCDNCSTDSTVPLLKGESKHDRHIKIIVNSRNFGILKNTYNGVLNAKGDAIILFMPVDLQDPPDLIPEFVTHWEKGYEVVYGIRARREEGFLIRNARKLYYKVLSKLTYVDYPEGTGDFQLIDRVVLDAMKKIDDAQPFMRLMTFDCGFSSIGIPYTWKARQLGTSHNRYIHMLAQGMNGIVSYSGAPLRFALIFGSILSGFSVVYSLVMGLLSLSGYPVLSFGTPMTLFFIGGIQLISIGILGEYILAIFNQVRKRPLVIERERINFDD